MLNSNGQVHVSGYTRSDGIQVSDYYRGGCIDETFMPTTSTAPTVVPNILGNVLNALGEGDSDVAQICPALAALFGTPTNIPTVMNDDGDDGGDDGGSDGGDGGDGGDDGGSEGGDDYPPVLQGGVEKDGYPDWWPDPEGGGDSSDPGNDQDPNDAVTSIDKGLSSVISQVLNIVLGTATQASTGTLTGASAINKLNTSIQALKEIQNLQKQNLDNLLPKVTATKNQDEYSKFLNQYSQQKEQYQQTQNLINQIDYSAQNKDYASVANNVEKYTQQQTESANSNQSYNKDWQDSTDLKSQQSLNSSFNSNASYNDYAHPQVEDSINSNNPTENFLPKSNDIAQLLKSGTSVNNQVFSTKATAPVSSIPTYETETADVMSASATVTDFMKNLNKMPEIDSNVIKQAFVAYQGATGQQIQAEIQTNLQSSIEKIAQECVDGAKAFKLATEISERVAPILTYAYITQQYIQGFQKGGVWNGIARIFVAGVESSIATAVFGVLIGTELPILTSASFALLASLLIDNLFEQVLNYFKL